MSIIPKLKITFEVTKIVDCSKIEDYGKMIWAELEEASIKKAKSEITNEELKVKEIEDINPFK